MVGGSHRNPVESEVPPPRLREPRSGTLEAAKRRGAERHEDPRSDGLDLALEVRPTSFHLVRLRRPVRGGSTFNQVRDEDVLPRDAGGGEGPIEHLAGGPHKRSAGRILLPSRRFADQEQVGVDGAFPGDRPAPVPVQPTQRAFPDPGGDLLEDDRAFTRRAHAAGWPGVFIAFVGSLFVFRHPVREGLDLRLDPFDLSLEFRSDPFEFPFRLEPVHGVLPHRVLGSPDLRAVPRLDPPKPFQFSFELVRGRNLRTPARAHPNRGPHLKDRFRAITTSRTPLVYVYFSVSRSAAKSGRRRPGTPVRPTSGNEGSRRTRSGRSRGWRDRIAICISRGGVCSLRAGPPLPPNPHGPSGVGPRPPGSGLPGSPGPRRGR